MIKNIGWTLGNDCPCKCKHCYSFSVRQKGKNLTKEIVDKVIEQIEKLNVETVNLGGNEPIFTNGLDVKKSMLPYILKELNKRNIKVGITTAGISLIALKNTYPECLELLNDVDISFDSPFKKEHNENRGGDVYKYAIQALEICKEYNIESGIIMCAMNWNFTKDRIATSTRYFRIGYVQGVNKGLYTNNVQNMLSNFNNYVTNDSTSKLLTWHYNSNTKSYYFVPELSVTVEKDSPRYILHVHDSASTGNYTYTWFIDGTLDSSITGNIAVINSTWTEGHDVSVLVSNGQSYTMINFEIPLLELHVSFEHNQQTGILTGNIDGTGLVDPNFNLNDYTYKWYKIRGNLKLVGWFEFYNLST